MDAEPAAVVEKSETNQVDDEKKDDISDNTESPSNVPTEPQKNPLSKPNSIVQKKKKRKICRPALEKRRF